MEESVKERMEESMKERMEESMKERMEEWRNEEKRKRERERNREKEKEKREKESNWLKVRKNFITAKGKIMRTHTRFIQIHSNLSLCNFGWEN
jgi:magnesium-transporting ATPase (P-type)